MANRFTSRIDTHAIYGLSRKLDQLIQPMTRDDADKIGSTCVATMKDMISKGNSPIAQYGRFPQYKNPKRYPGKRKALTPVNLYLTGDFMANLNYNIIQARFGYSASIGYSDPKQQVKELGHREGANGQPVRPTIPAQGEQFAKLIQDGYLRVVLDALERIRRS